MRLADFRSGASKSMKTFPAFRPLRGSLVSLAFLLAACSPKAPEAPKVPAGPPGKLGTAVVAGRVTLEGAPPANTRVTMTTDPFCNGQHPGETEMPEVAVGPEGALENVLLRASIEAVFVMPNENFSYTSSSLVKQVARHGGDVSKFVPPNVAEALRAVYAST